MRSRSSGGGLSSPKSRTKTKQRSYVPLIFWRRMGAQRAAGKGHKGQSAVGYVWCGWESNRARVLMRTWLDATVGRRITCALIHGVQCPLHALFSMRHVPLAWGCTPLPAGGSNITLTPLESVYAQLYTKQDWLARRPTPLDVYFCLTSASFPCVDANLALPRFFSQLAVNTWSKNAIRLAVDNWAMHIYDIMATSAGEKKVTTHVGALYSIVPGD
ncbi:hypothetical protein DFH09DRAFT_1407023 [Mycena vulgaris]|nr:hypothetical protein DFH09DRAFT_1407023 [Mycena vulgaris]